MHYCTRNLLVSVFVFFALCIGVTEAAAAVKAELGSYELEGDYMYGTLDLTKDGGAIKANVSLVMNTHPHNMAEMDGSAVIQGNKITIKSSEGDDAKLTVTFVTTKKLVIKGNEAAQGYAGNNATFDGDYTYVKAGKKVKPSKITVSADELKRMSIFLSNFTEIGLYEIHNANRMTLDELVHFGVQHNFINNKKLVKKLKSGVFSIDGKSVAESIKKYFALDIKTSELASVSYIGQNYDYDGKNYTFTQENAYDTIYYARVTGVYKEGSKILLEGEIYNIKDTNDVLGSFSAYAKPWKYGGKETWALLSLK